MRPHIFTIRAVFRPSVGQSVSADYATSCSRVALWFSPPALKNYATRSFLIFFLCMKNKKEWPNLCSMRLERAMLSYTWVYHGCCDKSRKNVIFVLNRLKNYFFRSVKGVFDVKWCEEFKKVGPKALECLIFKILGVFYKNRWMRFCGKTLKMEKFQ